MIDDAAETTQSPAKFVPAPIAMATPSSSPPSSTCSQQPGPTNTRSPTAIRRSPPIRKGGWIIEWRPNEWNAPELATENALPHVRPPKR